MAGRGHTFFQALEGLETRAEAEAAFDQYIAKPLPLGAAEFHGALYHALVERLLGWLGLASGPGAALREWRPLYRLAGEIDPFYFTREQLERALAACPPMGAATREEIAAVLAGYFGLRREGFPAGFPAPLVSEGDGARWAALFPPRLAWRSLEVLHAVGLYPVGSRAGYRAFKRFEEGVFEPEEGPEGLPAWRRLCADGAAGPDGGPRRDFLAGAFAGGHRALGLEGFCGDVPRCKACPLGRECQWAATTGGEGVPEALGRLGQGKGGGLSNAQLLRALFRLDAEAARVLAGGLNETPLRRLADKSPQELADWLEGTGLERERLLGLFELCRRYNAEQLAPGVALVSAEKVFQHFRLRLRDFPQEQFLAVFLDTRRRFIGEAMVTQGTLSSSPVHPREVFSPAIRERAASVIVVHNHPSGDATPSREDIEITHRLVQAGATVGIPVVDHIIVAGETYFSFLERELM